MCSSSTEAKSDTSFLGNVKKIEPNQKKYQKNEKKEDPNMKKDITVCLLFPLSVFKVESNLTQKLETTNFVWISEPNRLPKKFRQDHWLKKAIPGEKHVTPHQ